MTLKTDKRNTFVVQIMNQQHSTWQGTITWTVKGETRHFRSALELIKLIDSTLEQSTTENGELA